MMRLAVVRSPLVNSRGDFSRKEIAMECENFSCELGKLIIEGINPDFKTGNYEISYYYKDKNIVTVSFMCVPEGSA